MKANECKYCNGEIHPKKVTVNHSYKGKLAIIKGVLSRGLPRVWAAVLCRRHLRET